MTANERVMVGCTHGEEGPDRVVVAYLTAGARRVLDHGKRVVMWLSSEGVRLALQGYVKSIRAELDPPVKRVHDQFIEKGSSFYVRPICFNGRGLDPSALVDRAELKGGCPLMEFASEGATTFSYESAGSMPEPVRPVVSHEASMMLAREEQPRARLDLHGAEVWVASEPVA
jgi:uncharacterized protein